MSIPIVPKREIEERAIEERAKLLRMKELKIPVLNLKIGPQNINPRDGTAYDIPFEAIPSKIFKSPIFRDNVILDIRKKLRKVEERINYCNIDALNAICEISKLADIQSRYFAENTAFDLLVGDIDDIQKKFIYNCRSIAIENIKGNIEKDVRSTFEAINVPMNPEDRIEMFSFYLSGLMKGYMSVFESMRIEFGSSLIDNIMTVFIDYEKGKISAYDTWKYIEELLIQ